MASRTLQTANRKPQASSFSSVCLRLYCYDRYLSGSALSFHRRFNFLYQSIHQASKQSIPYPPPRTTKPEAQNASSANSPRRRPSLSTLQPPSQKPVPGPGQVTLSSDSGPGETPNACDSGVAFGEDRGEQEG